MAYHGSYKGLDKKTRTPKKGNTFLFLFVGIGTCLFFLLVILFRMQKPEVVLEQQNTATLLTSIETEKDSTESLSLNAVLVDPVTQKPIGSVVRKFTDSTFHLTSLLQPPDIDRELYFYELWLVRDVPYDFVSAGAFVTNEEGEFVLDWEGEEDKSYADYHELVVTLQVKGGDTDPQRHVAKGDFEN